MVSQERSDKRALQEAVADSEAAATAMRERMVAYDAERVKLKRALQQLETTQVGSKHT